MVMREVVIREVPAMNVVSVDHVGSYMQIGKAFDSLIGWLAGRNLLSAEMRMIGIFYDDPGIVAEAELRSKAGVVLPRDVDVYLEPRHLAGSHQQRRAVRGDRQQQRAFEIVLR